MVKNALLTEILLTSRRTVIWDHQCSLLKELQQAWAYGRYLAQATSAYVKRTRTEDFRTKNAFNSFQIRTPILTLL